ncbi:hypothetical protein ATO8_11644 [Roseivivax marinus]|jgi:hypothetical protein|uniref:Cell division protein FtsL n=1 Tax=Roseivivax marinus TaxID=1379903 RepID=W4HIY0_9RHOB|nr:cell division protein FtsL [Roseivivax marinus]ETW12669.1 hypothetical protein ATO8_11644 [Roseivivax marinus]UMA65741.1 cell division protein FtsL [Roseivivax marinus]SEL18568.1 hypothetical protein SAMN05444413_106195 [Roseivivax marinus]
MRTFVYVLTALAVIGLGFWAYHENYKTQAVLSESEHYAREIGRAHERLSMLRAEWAYLNRPERLRDLAEINFDRLGLLPFHPDQFGRVDQVAYPQPTETGLEIEEPVDISSQGAEP